MLEETDLAVLRFHQLYKELPPTELFPHVQQYLQAVTGLLEESQTIEVRRRLPPCQHELRHFGLSIH